MRIILPPLQGMLLVYLLTFARTGAMIMLLPAIGDTGVPVRVRLAFALAVAAVLVPLTAKYYPAVSLSPIDLGVLIAREATAGVLVGAMARLIMSALETAGFLIAGQTGLSFATAFDPSQGMQGAMVSTFLSLLGVLLVFETDLHHLSLGAIAGSYVLLPPGGDLPTSDMAQLVLNLTTSAFALGLQLAAPFMVFGFVIYVVLGVMSRAMPQMQVFFLSMPINIMVGFVLLMLFLSVIMNAYLEFYTTQMRQFGL